MPKSGTFTLTNILSGFTDVSLNITTATGAGSTTFENASHAYEQRDHIAWVRFDDNLRSVSKMHYFL